MVRDVVHYQLTRQWAVESLLSALYPGVAFDQFTDSELLDLYLREGRLATWEEREWYGYFSDRYYDHTHRDQAIKRWTQYLTRRFLERALNDAGCMAKVLCYEYRPSPGRIDVLLCDGPAGPAGSVTVSRRAYGRDL